MKRESPPTPRNLIGSRLREIRRAMRPRISQEDLCGRAASDGVTLTRTQVAKIEAGTRPVTDYELMAIARALHIALDDLLPGAAPRGRSRSR